MLVRFGACRLLASVLAIDTFRIEHGLLGQGLLGQGLLGVLNSVRNLIQSKSTGLF
jgi:hypothetical protein